MNHHQTSTQHLLESELKESPPPVGPDARTPMAGLVCATLNQQRAPVDVRAIAADPDIDWAARIRSVLPQDSAWFILSTCNRFEIYLFGPTLQPVDLRVLLAGAFSKTDTGQPTDVIQYFDFHLGDRAARHLFQVAAGLESKVFGESQILGQLTRAYEAHVAMHTLGHELDAVLRAAIRVGKRIRHETAIGANAGSIGALAIQMVEAHHAALAQSTIAVVGLGEMGRLIARSLVARGAKRVVLLNRTFENALRLAQEIDAEALPWQALARAVAEADVVFCATSAPDAVITPALWPRAEPFPNRHMASVASQKVLVDLAVPRDVDLTVAQVAPVAIIDLDNLQSDLDEGLAQRHAALPQAIRMIESELSALQTQMRELASRPLIVDLRLKAEEIRQAELARTLRFIQDADPEVARHVEHLSRALVNKLLHDPTTRLRAMAGDDARTVPDALVRELFGLGTDETSNTPNHASAADDRQKDWPEQADEHSSNEYSSDESPPAHFTQTKSVPSLDTSEVHAVTDCECQLRFCPECCEDSKTDDTADSSVACRAHLPHAGQPDLACDWWQNRHHAPLSVSASTSASTSFADANSGVIVQAARHK